MKHGFCAIFLLSILINPASAEERQHSFGVGLGTLTNGLGINWVIEGTQDTFILSTGCHDIFGDFNSACGVSGSWLRTLDTQDRRHAAGVMIGAVGKHEVEDPGFLENDDETAYGAKLVYRYRLSDSLGEGLWFAAGVGYGKSDEDSSAVADIGISYQF